MSKACLYESHRQDDRTKGHIGDYEEGFYNFSQEARSECNGRVEALYLYSFSCLDGTGYCRNWIRSYHCINARKTSTLQHFEHPWMYTTLVIILMSLVKAKFHIGRLSRNSRSVMTNPRMQQWYFSIPFGFRGHWILYNLDLRFSFIIQTSSGTSSLKTSLYALYSNIVLPMPR